VPTTGTAALDDLALALFEHSDEGVLVTHPDGTILRVNAAACRILDRSADEIVRLGRGPLVVADDALARFLAVRARTGIARGALTLRRADGAAFPVECTSLTVRISGERQVLLVVFRDVSALRAAEEAQARLAAIVEGSDDAIISKDLDGSVTSWNAGAERMFGWRSAEIVGRPVDVLIPPDRRDEEALILALLRRGERVEPLETVRLHRDGRPVEVSLSVSPIRDHGGRVVGASKIIRDVTERNRSERALAEAREREETLAGLIPICMDCKQVRNDRGFWDHIEEYLSSRSRAQFSHALCPACLARRCPPGGEP
jgi:PAS domain S-box-containing protein